jgi:hypothetical protein
MISRKGCGLSRPNLNLDGANLGWPGSPRGFEAEKGRFMTIFFHEPSLFGVDSLIAPVIKWSS